MCSVRRSKSEVQLTQCACATNPDGRGRGAQQALRMLLHTWQRLQSMDNRRPPTTPILVGIQSYIALLPAPCPLSPPSDRLLEPLASLCTLVGAIPFVQETRPREHVI